MRIAEFARPFAAVIISFCAGTVRVLGFVCGRHRVARRRWQADIDTRKRRVRICSHLHQGQRVFPNVLEQCFEVSRPDRLLVPGRLR